MHWAISDKRALRAATVPVPSTIRPAFSVDAGRPSRVQLYFLTILRAAGALMALLLNRWPMQGSTHCQLLRNILHSLDEVVSHHQVAHPEDDRAAVDEVQQPPDITSELSLTGPRFQHR